MIPPELLKKILDAIASGDEKAQAALLPEIVAAIASGAPADPNAAPEPMSQGADPKPADPNAPQAMSQLSKLLGFSSDAEAAAEIKKLMRKVTEHQAEAEGLDLEARRALCAELVTLGVEFPATVWKLGKVGERELTAADRIPADRLMLEPLAELRARVALHRSKGPVRVAAEAPPSGASDVAAEVAKLSAETLSAIKKKGITPEQFISERAGVLKSNKAK